MLKKSAFFDFLNRHREIDFDGYLEQATQDEDYIDWHHFVLPNDYGDAEQEYRSIRNGCAMFDASPIRKYRIHGPGAGSFLDHLCTRRVSQSPSMRGVYVAYCNENGTLKDDSILYKYAEDDYLLMPSDIDHDAYFESLRCRLGLDDLSVVECTSSLIGMAIQGPMSASLLHRWGLDAIENLEPFEVREYPLGGGAMRVSRMGFTADLGYECWLEPDLSEAFQQGIVEAGESLSLEVPGYGLTALEACRLEGGLIVPGWDCSTEADPNPDLERTPFELGVGWLVDFDDRNFVGREALLEYKRTGHRFLRRSFIAETHREPEPGAEIHSTVDGGDSVIGAITCARWSWGFERVVGSASIERPSAGLTEAWVQVEDERVPLQLARGALVDLERRSQTPAPIHD